MLLGETLRKARLTKQLTTSDVAKATRIKVQIVEAIEKDRFDQIPAPIYAKGFIRLFADYVGLDPEPLVLEYNRRRADPGGRSAQIIETADADGLADADEDAKATDLFDHAGIFVPGEAGRTEPARPTSVPAAAPVRRDDPAKPVLSGDLERHAPRRPSLNMQRTDSDPIMSGPTIGSLFASGALAVGRRLQPLVLSAKQLWRDIAPRWRRMQSRRKAFILGGAAMLLALFVSALFGVFARDAAPDDPPPPADRIAVLGVDTPEPYFD